MREDKVVLQGF